MLCLIKGKMRLRSHVQVVTLRGSARTILPVAFPALEVQRCRRLNK